MLACQPGVAPTLAKSRSANPKLSNAADPQLIVRVKIAIILVNDFPTKQSRPSVVSKSEREQQLESKVRELEAEIVELSQTRPVAGHG